MVCIISFLSLLSCTAVGYVPLFAEKYIKALYLVQCIVKVTTVTDVTSCIVFDKFKRHRSLANSSQPRGVMLSKGS